MRVRHFFLMLFSLCMLVGFISVFSNATSFLFFGIEKAFWRVIGGFIFFVLSGIALLVTAYFAQKQIKRENEIRQRSSE